MPVSQARVDGTKAHNDDDDARVEGVRPPREGKGLASHVDKQPSPAQPTSNLSYCATCVWIDAGGQDQGSQSQAKHLWSGIGRSFAWLDMTDDPRLFGAGFSAIHSDITFIADIVSIVDTTRPYEGFVVLAVRDPPSSAHAQTDSGWMDGGGGGGRGGWWREVVVMLVLVFVFAGLGAPRLHATSDSTRSVGAIGPPQHDGCHRHTINAVACLDTYFLLCGAGDIGHGLLETMIGSISAARKPPVWRSSRSQLSEQCTRELSFDPSLISTAGGHLCWLELGHDLSVRNPNRGANAARCTDLGKRATSSPTIKPPRPFLACIISDAGPWMQILRESSFADPRLNRTANLGDGGRWTARAPPLAPPKLGFTAPANRLHDDG
ncbi:hypothetical protein MRS44_001552 [Fusarium solani]|uniref:uncharacterized protein n=1 Tax=Fusarium solani TaxID=169388 RepID=UPI0032C417FF|nr:hypothetical protein MRS44_001552 [Fusarium solani]